MSFDPILLIYAALFVATLLLIEGLYYLVRDMREGPRQALNRRMRMIAAGTDTQTALRKLRRDTKDPLARMLAGIVPSTDKLILHACCSSWWPWGRSSSEFWRSPPPHPRA
jgi:hypothetical protein